ncbi:MAG: methionyl-tRNA formyltransferase [Tissierellia bacterium]|nr:methionyl-tRNA formyltransferase [Tissierellia bacterium]
MAKGKLKTVFFGTPDFAIPALETAHESSEVLLVVTQEDRQRGRGRKLSPTPVKERALELGLPVAQPAKVNDPEFLAQLEALSADLFIVVAYGQILSQALIDLPQKTIINLHASILPKYRGAAPIQRSIMEGEVETGVSLMEITAGLDAGPVALVKSTEIGDMDTGALTEVLAQLGAEALSDFLEAGGEMEFKPQDHDGATYAQKITKEDQLLDPNTMTAVELLRAIRGLSPEPGAKLSLWGEEYTIYEGALSSEKLAPGEIRRSKKQLWLGAKEGSIEILSLKKPGKKRMETRALLAGLRD